MNDARGKPETVRRSPAELWKAWTAKKPGEKNLHVVVAAIVVTAIYLVAIAPLAGKQIDKIRYDLEKQKAREKSSLKLGKAPAPPLALGGKSLKEAEKELETLRTQLEETRAAVQSLNAAFVPLEDTLAMNALKTGLTSLAEAGDMEVLAVEHLYARPDDKDRPPTPQLIAEAARSNPFQRPLLLLRARASYGGLMQFLFGLADLPYVASPVWSDISVGVERHPETKQPVRQWLEVTIKFAV